MWCWTRSGRTTVSACVTSIYSDHDPHHEVACDYQARIHTHAAIRDRMPKAAKGRAGCCSERQPLRPASRLLPRDRATRCYRRSRVPALPWPARRSGCPAGCGPRLDQFLNLGGPRQRHPVRGCHQGGSGHGHIRVVDLQVAVRQHQCSAHSLDPAGRRQSHQIRDEIGRVVVVERTTAPRTHEQILRNRWPVIAQ
jgi:hypothetical protein